MDSNVFRLFSSDIGLLTSAYPAETKIELIGKNGEVNNGAHFENFVAQQLTANGFEPYFCKKKKAYEFGHLSCVCYKRRSTSAFCSRQERTDK